MSKSNGNAPGNPKMPWYHETRDPLYRVFYWGVVSTFIIMVIMAWIQVVSRYFFKYPLGWTSELAQIMLFWFVFLSVGTLTRHRRLMKVDAFTVKLPPTLRLIVSALVYFSSAVFFGWLSYLSVQLMDLASGQVSTALHIPYKYIYLSLPIGLTCALIYCTAIGYVDLKEAFSNGPDSDDGGHRSTCDY